MQISSFYVQPIPLWHDVECIGFLVSNPKMGKLCFVTDSGKVPWTFNGLSHILCEVNWTEDDMIDSIIDGKFIQRERLLENHLSFDRAIDFLKRNINAKTRNIVFLHLSNNNTNYHKILSEAKRQLSFENIFIAEKGLEIEINKNLF